MPDFSILLGFLAASLVVLLVPGPGVLYTVTRSVSQGQRAGFVSVLGLSFGALAHVIAATVGLSAILLASATAFTVVKLLGALYLIYLGLKTILQKQDAVNEWNNDTRSLYRVFRDGVAISVLNPKIAVFFLAYLPQFTDPTKGSVTRQILYLGLIYIGLALLTDGAYAYFASRLRDWFSNRLIQGSYPRVASGLVYIGLGVTTALADRR